MLIEQKVWTRKEIDFLEKEYPTSTISRIAKVLNRTPPSIQKKAYRLGLRKARSFFVEVNRWNPRIIWTKEMDETLRKLYPTTPDKKIAKMLGRKARQSIYWRARKLGLYKSKEYLSKLRRESWLKRPIRQGKILTLKRWTEEEKENLKKLISEHKSYREIATILKRSKSSVEQHAFNLGLTESGKGRYFSLSPTKELGYLCGLIAGDGWLDKNSRNYSIHVVTTRVEFAWHTARAMNRVGLSPVLGERLGTRTFPNGTTRTDKMFSVIANSKILYEALRPYKRAYYWRIPKFLTTDESLRGFLQGIFDAEGSAPPPSGIGGGAIRLVQKSKSHILIIKKLLGKYGISCQVHPTRNCWRLNICGKENKKRFYELIGFGLDYKQKKLEEDLTAYKIPRVS